MNQVHKIYLLTVSANLKNRFIGESVRFTQDIIDKFDLENKTGIILQLDFEKAFDSVEWHFLLKVSSILGNSLYLM